jgi:5-methylcytosine-specific restriction endonuclease McrA
MWSGDRISSDVRELIEQRARSASEHRDSLCGRTMDSLALPVLVLNRVFEPVRITTARRAISLLYTGCANAVDEQGELIDFAAWRVLPIRAGDDALAIVSGALRVPRIVHLRRYARACQPTVRLTRRNVMLRDGYQCQYCGKHAAARELDIDHVLPRSRGGEDSWVNLVTACLGCNRRKGHRTPPEAAMPLLRKPSAPRWSLAVQLLVQASASYKEWEPFLKAS